LTYRLTFKKLGSVKSFICIWYPPTGLMVASTDVDWL